MAMAMSNEAIREELTRKIWGYVYYLHNISTEWGLVLLHPDFDEEPELRNRAFAMWIWGFAENAAESTNSLNHLRRLSAQIDAKIALYYVDLIAKLHAGVADVLSPLSFGDMVIIQNHRNRAAHGELFAVNRRVHYSDGYFVHTKKIAVADATKICTERWMSEGWEPQLLDARVRVLSKPSLFWFIHDSMLNSSAADRIISDLSEWDNSIQPGVLVDFIDDDYQATQSAFERDLRTFWFNRSGVAAGSTRRLDPAVELIEAKLKARKVEINTESGGR